MARPIGDVDVLDAHRLAGARRMDELAVAQVDAHVREGAAHRVEEHEVARLQVLLVDLGEFGRVGLLVGAHRQHAAKTVLEDVAREARAVEAGFGGLAAQLVAHAQEVHRGVDQARGAVAHLRDQLRALGGDRTRHRIEQALVVDRAHGGLANGLRSGQRRAERRHQRRRHHHEPNESGEVAGRLGSRCPSTVLDNSHRASIQDARFGGQPGCWEKPE